MGYYDNKDNDNRQYEDWHQYGRDRGFFDRATDEVRSWFGDEDAEQRRMMDQRNSGEGRGYGRGRENERPEWQRRDYSGSSPRGSRVEEYGRYDQSRDSGRGRMGLRQWDENGGRFSGGRGMGMERGYGEYGYGSSGLGSSGYGSMGSGSTRYGSMGYGSGESQRMGRDWENQQPRWFDRDRDRDFESGMPYGSNMGRSSGMTSGRDWPGRNNEWNRGGDWNRNDEQGMLGHRGRGPRNYRRSDERISDEINEFLTLHPELDATDIDVIVEEGIVTLRGRVNTRQCKRIAEDIAEDVYGVREVHNELRVDRNSNLTNNQESQSIGRPNLLSR